MRLRRLPWLFMPMVLAANLASAQQAPLFTVVPRQEKVRQLELRADLHMIRKQYLQALDFYQEALQYDSDNALLLNKIGIAHHQLFHLRDAKKYYERSTKADKSYAQAWNNLGTAYYGEKNYKRAIKAYRRAIEINPTDATMRSNLGTALFARKKYDEALQEYRLAMLLNPDVFDQRSIFGILMQERTVEDRAQFYYLIGKSFAILGYVDKCIHYLRRALEDGYSREELQNDPAFAGLMQDERFQELLKLPPDAPP